MGRLIVASNRVADPRKAGQSGGLAVALADALRKREAVWFGWDGKIADAAQARASSERAVRGRTTLLTTPLSRGEHDEYYLGYANSVLWPVFHNRLDLAKFEGGYFPSYAGVNERFARLLAPHVRDDDDIWVHDYHLVPLAGELRTLGVASRIAFFLHIPFPPAEAFSALPEHRLLAQSLSRFDLIGLQTKADVANFLYYVEHSGLGRLLPDGYVQLCDRRVMVESFPVGIDPEYFAHRASRSDGRQGADLIRVIGVDRLDYSKGLPQKFRAFDRFLAQAPEYRGRAVLTQIAPPTRESVDAYTDIRRELETLTGGINGRYGDLDWVPIHYIHRSVGRSRLADIYAASKVGLVTPLRDGMNLVAKEYVAAQPPLDPGVLILSRFAGAAEDMAAAMIVNPYDVDEVARAIRTAIEMPLGERLARHRSLSETLAETSAAKWGQAILDRLHASHSPGRIELPRPRAFDTALRALGDVDWPSDEGGGPGFAAAATAAK